MVAWIFGDSFDPYAYAPPVPCPPSNFLWTAGAEMVRNYWDSPMNGSNINYVTGRSPGRQALSIWGSVPFSKTSGANHSIHRFNLAISQNTNLGASNPAFYLQLLDGSTNQCCVVFGQDGALALLSGGPTGSGLAMWLGALPQAFAWHAFEIEVVIDGSAGSFTVWRNGNPIPDFRRTGLNTRTTANNYANKLTINSQTGNVGQVIQDLLWRSDQVPIPWLGDVVCQLRAPVSDVQAQWTRQTSYATLLHPTFISALTPQVGWAYYVPMGALTGGVLTSVTLYLNAASAGNVKCALYSAGPTPYGGASGSYSQGRATGPPQALVQAATAPISSPAAGANTFTFSPGVTLVQGQCYCIAFCSDTATTNMFFIPSSVFNEYWSMGYSQNVTYAAFPPTVPNASGDQPVMCAWTITPSANAMLVGEQHEDGSMGSYIYSSTVGQADFYNIGTIGSTPVNTVLVTVRGFMQKTEQGARSAAVQIRSGSTTVSTPTLSLTTPWTWAWRSDQTDPNTGAAWTSAAVAALQIGPVLTA